MAVYRAGWAMETRAGMAARIAVELAPRIVADASARYRMPVPGLKLKARVQRSCYCPTTHTLTVAECQHACVVPSTVSGMVLCHELAHAVHAVQHRDKFPGQYVPRALWHAAPYVLIYSQLIAQYLPACLPIWQDECKRNNVLGA